MALNTPYNPQNLAYSASHPMLQATGYLLWSCAADFTFAGFPSTHHPLQSHLMSSGQFPTHL